MTHAKRITTGFVLAFLAIWGSFYAPPLIFAALICVFVIGAGIEWASLISSCSYIKCSFVLSLVVAMAVAHFYIHWAMYLAGIWWIVAFSLLFNYKQRSRHWVKSKWFLWPAGILTLAPMLAAAMWLRNVSHALVFFLILVVPWNDTGAYFTGYYLGKNKLSPNLSPKKTVEGLLGGIVCALISAWAMSYFIPQFFHDSQTLHTFAWLAMGLWCVMIATLGDLFESFVKRQLDVKDSGSLLPGHGGLLDRIDSLSAAFPLFLLLYWALT